MGSITDSEYQKPARRGDIASVAIKTSNALITLVILLHQIERGEKPNIEEIDGIKRISDELEATFDRLAGWVDEETKDGEDRS